MAHTEDGDYSRTATRISLNHITTGQCVTIQLIEDDIVEIDETFLAQVEQIVSSDDLRFPLNPEYTLITIIDNDGEQNDLFLSQHIHEIIQISVLTWISLTVMLMHSNVFVHVCMLPHS